MRPSQSLVGAAMLAAASAEQCVSLKTRTEMRAPRAKSPLPPVTATTRSQPSPSKPTSSDDEDSTSTAGPEPSSTDCDEETQGPEPSTTEAEETPGPEPSTTDCDEETPAPEPTTTDCDEETQGPEPSTTDVEETPAPEPTTTDCDEETQGPEPSTTEVEETPGPEPTTSDCDEETPVPEPTTTDCDEETPTPEPTTSDCDEETPAPEPTTTEVEETPAPEPTATDCDEETPAPEPTTTDRDEETPHPSLPLLTTTRKPRNPAPEPTTTDCDETPAPEPTTTDCDEETPAPEPTTTDCDEETPAPQPTTTDCDEEEATPTPGPATTEEEEQPTPTPTPSPSTTAQEEEEEPSTPTPEPATTTEEEEQVTTTSTTSTPPAVTTYVRNYPADIVDQLRDESMQKLKDYLAKNPPKSGCTLEKASIRREWGDLSDPEREDYIGAVKCLQALPAKTSTREIPGARSRFDDFVAAHILQTNYIHNTANFLSWHRYFVAAYEKALREECGYAGAHPYWNWDRYAKNPCITTGPFASMKVNLGPGSSVKYNPRCLTRDISTAYAKFTTVEYSYPLIATSNTISKFQDTLQGRNQVHGGGHFTIGGDPGSNVFASPGDPAFYLHHAGVDRIWWIWQLQDLNTRLSAVAGSVTGSKKTGTLDDSINLGVNGAAKKIRDMMNTMDGDLCYIYL
ncbi:unnamed protein product [Parascedosporium putredinis]|uniref:Tyrosinase copper-binding domain-containing protein n=1 Tax=Parascedosporium putredinis TaxID=1442378 RepID=A0A9P1H547_9PEZI|nr:unnamed protein product [Parascedosporium putredinis]CAI7996153.1 unnamed protein product [Parascedosporium putredinis]